MIRKLLAALVALAFSAQTAFATGLTYLPVTGADQQQHNLAELQDTNGYLYPGMAIVDGTAAANRAAVKAASTAPQATDPALVVSLSPNGNSVSVSGSVTVSSLPSVTVSSLPALPTGSNTIGAVTQSGSWSVAVSSCSGCASSNGSVSNTGSAVPSQATYLGASVSGTLTGLVATSNGLKVDGSAVTQPVSLSSLPALATGSNTIGAVTQASGPWSVNETQIGGTSIVTGGVAGSQGVGGLAASGAAVAGDPIYQGCRAQNAEQTAVTTGQAVGAACDLVGKQIVMPYANKENFLAGENSATGTSATTLIAAQGASVKIYVTSIQCFNSGATTSTVALNNTEADGHNWTGVNFTGAGLTATFPAPLVVAANTALTFTPGSSSTTQYCSAQGYSGI